MRFGSSSDGHSRQQQYLSIITKTKTTSPKIVLPKLQTAYSNIENRRRILSFDIEKIDSSINLSAVDHLCIVGSSSGNERKYTNAFLMRLCVRALISKRQRSGGAFEESTKVIIFIDAGGKSSDVYQCVNFARQYYGLDIKKILRSIIVTRAFTIYQLADLIIYQLPKIIQQFNNGKVIVVVIADLLDLFTQDPNSIDREEAISLLKEIVDSIKKTLDNTLVVVSFNQPSQQQQQHHNNKSNAYHKILLPRFDKRIVIIKNNSSSKINTLDVKVYSNNHGKKDCNTSLVLEERDLLQIISDPTR
jgi:hypothetical protein